jgi:hypothetical protein
MASFGAVRHDQEPLSKPISNPQPLPCKPLPTRRESGGSNAGQSLHRSGSVLQFLALGLDRAEQVLPRFIVGLGALRLQVGRQLFEIDSCLLKVVQNDFAVPSIARKSSRQFAMISKGQNSAPLSLFHHFHDVNHNCKDFLC